MSKVYPITDLNALPLLEQYAYFGLFDQGGGVIIPFNSNKVPGSQRLREIEKRLFSAGCLDGYYNVKCKNSPGVKVVADTFTFYKGEQLSEGTAAPMIQAPQQFSPEVLSYESALKLQVEVERYKLENANLRRQVTELETELNNLEKEQETLSEGAAPGMWENAKGFLSELVQMGAPLLDKHYELKEKALALKAMELQSRLNMRPPSPGPQAPRSNPTQEQKSGIENTILSFKETDPDTYESLASIYNTATGEEDFLKNVQLFDPEIFKAFTNGK
jgi:hypothetical protein